MPLIYYSLSKNNNLYKVIRDWNDCNYFYIVADGNTKLVVPSIVKSGNFVVAVCTEFEAYYDIVDRIYKELVFEQGISPSKILLISENSDLSQHILETAKQYNTEPIKYEWSLIAQIIIKRQVIKNLSKLKDIRPKTKKSNKYFLNFNRRWRMHRTVLVGLLCASELLDKGHVSLGKSDGIQESWPTVIDVVIGLLEKDELLAKLIKDNIEKIANLNPLYLDTNLLAPSRAGLYYNDIDPTSTENLYQETAFSVVSETYFFDNNGRYFTEKTFKPIAYHHPFILVSKPFSLKLLRELGYQTFHPFIDEKYDEEVDNVKRMRMILEEIKRLCDMNDEELSSFLKNVQPITEHNFNRLISKAPYIYKKL
jgi:hypothetical protein